MIELDLVGRALRLGGVLINRETRRARSRHSRQPGAICTIERRDYLADQGLNSRCRYLEVIRAGGQGLDPLLKRSALLGPGRCLEHHVSRTDQKFAVSQPESFDPAF